MITCNKKFFLDRVKESGVPLSDAMPCVAAQDGDQWTIDVDHPAYPRRRIRESGPRKKEQEPAGPGTELKKLLAKIGIHASPSCSCNTMALQMNRWGQDSLNHMDEIVAVMQETAKKRNLPFSRTAAKALVRIACWRARRGNG